MYTKSTSQRHAEGSWALIGSVLAAWLLFCIFSSLTLQGGYIQPEVNSYFPYYLGSGGLIAKLWNPNATEVWGEYQAREISYFFDWIDCHVINFSIRHGIPHVLSLSFFLFTLAIAGACARLMRLLKYNTSVILLTLGLIFSDSNFLFGASYIRSAKFGAAACLAWLFVTLARPLTIWRTFFVVLLAFFASWFDEQGRFIAAVVGVILILHFRWKYILKGLITLLPAAFIAGPYNYRIDPWIIHAAHEYWPSFEYQNVSWTVLTDKPFDFISNGVDLLESSAAHIFSGIDRADVGFTAIALIFLGVFRRFRCRRVFWRDFAFFAFAMAVMFAVMAWRHPPVLAEGVRAMGYYLIPSSVLLLLCAVVATAKWRRHRFTKSLMILLLGLNLAADYFRMGDVHRMTGSAVIIVDAMCDAAAGRPVSGTVRSNELVEYYSAHHNRP